MASAESGSDYDPVLAELRTHAGALNGPTNCDDGDAADAIKDACGAAVRAVQARQVARRDIAVTLTMVRRTVDSLASRHKVTRTAVEAAITRLESLRQGTSLPEIKRYLGEEVVALRSIASESERALRAEISVLSQRLTMAEGQLSLSGDAALIDPLTNVTTRRGFDLALAHWIDDLDPSTPTVLALFDIDRLDAVNEQLGSAAGDALLKHVAITIRRAVRPADIVARIGGDEFALIASGLTLQLANSRLRYLVQAIADGSIASGGKPVSVRCGVAEFSAGDTPLTLLHRAGLALEEAKGPADQRVVTRAVPLVRDLLSSRRHGWSA
jgi:diguanylate cyclase